MCVLPTSLRVYVGYMYYSFRCIFPCSLYISHPGATGGHQGFFFAFFFFIFMAHLPSAVRADMLYDREKGPAVSFPSSTVLCNNVEVSYSRAFLLTCRFHPQSCAFCLTIDDNLFNFSSHGRFELTISASSGFAGTTRPPGRPTSYCTIIEVYYYAMLFSCFLGFFLQVLYLLCLCTEYYFTAALTVVVYANCLVRS